MRSSANVCPRLLHLEVKKTPFIACGRDGVVMVQRDGRCLRHRSVLVGTLRVVSASRRSDFGASWVLVDCTRAGVTPVVRHFRVACYGCVGARARARRLSSAVVLGYLSCVRQAHLRVEHKACAEILYPGATFVARCSWCCPALRFARSL